MKNKIVFFYILCFICLNSSIYAQLPCLNGPDNIIYIHQGVTIQNYNVTLPIGPGNPVVNTIACPSGSGGLAVANNINGPGPSPTFYTAVGGLYYYYDGTTWVNTGHAAGAVNHCGAGNFLYSLNGGTGGVYKYDGTGNAVLLLTVPNFSGGGPYDLVGNCDGSFYILRTNPSPTPAFLQQYNSNGVLLNSWTCTGSGGSAGGGFAIVNGNVYYHNTTGFLSAPFVPGNLAFSPVGVTIPGPSDMGSCEICDEGVDTIYHCLTNPNLPVTLNTNLMGNVLWTVQSGNASIVGGGASVNVNATSTSLITASVAPNTDSFLIIVPTATVNAGMDYTIEGCGTYADTLHATLSNTNPNLNYSIDWTPAANIVSGINTLDPTITQTGLTQYVISVSTDPNKGGCVWMDTINVDVDDFTPQADFSFNMNLGCKLDTVQFTNTSILNPNGNPSYFWSFGDGAFSTSTNPNHIYGYQSTFNVSLVVYDHGCGDSITHPVNTNHPLDADFSIQNSGPVADSVCLGMAFGFTPITVPNVALNLLEQYWDFGDGTIFTHIPPAGLGIPILHNYTQGGTYTVKLVVRDSLGCEDSVSKNVFVDVPPYVDMTATPKEICVGDQVIFKDTVADHTFRTIYDFGDGNTLVNFHNPLHTYSDAGNYLVQFIGEYLICPNDTAFETIVVHPYPLINLGLDTSYCPGLSNDITLKDINNPSAIYTWSTGDIASSITVKDPGYYWAKSSDFNCTATDSIWVKRDCYLNIPNSFSPNGDGLNDYFMPRQLLSSGVEEIDFKIFNRWGELIFRTNNVEGRGWDGKYGGKDQATGVFVYTIDVKFRNNFKTNFTGNVTLVR